MRTDWKRWLAMVFVVALAAATTPLAGHAEPPVEAKPPVMVVMDFSGSMNEADVDDNGTKRIDAAKQAVKSLFETAPDGAQIGLVAYGSRSDACDDAVTVQPAGPADAAAVTGKIDALEAKGNTPIGPALRHASSELGDERQKKAIILVSDGEPNCEPPPACEVAKELATHGIDLKVHTVGFRIAGNTKAQETLKCIAATTGGRYATVEDAPQLEEVLREETVRALEGYESKGIGVAGGKTVDQAQIMYPGQYVLRLPSGDEVPRDDPTAERDNARYFAVPMHEGWDPSITVTMVPPEDATQGERPEQRVLTVGEVAPTGGECLGPWEPVPHGFIDDVDHTASMTIRSEFGMCDNLDKVDDKYRFFMVSRHGPGWADKELDIELLVTMHNAQKTAGVKIQDPGESPGAPEAKEGGEKVAGGSSFNDATELKPGQTITDTIVNGEKRYFVVPVQTGQNMHVNLDVPPFDGVTSLSFTALNPLRQQMAFSRDAEHVGPMGGVDLVLHREAQSFSAPLNAAILPQNVSGNVMDDAHVFGGKQYLVVARDHDSHRDDGELTFHLSTAVWGEPSSGGVQMLTTPAEYLSEFGAPEGQQSPSPEESGEASSTAEESDKGSSPKPSESKKSDPSTTETDAEGSGGFPWSMTLGGVGVALLAAGGIWFGASRRR